MFGTLMGRLVKYPDIFVWIISENTGPTSSIAKIAIFGRPLPIARFGRAFPIVFLGGALVGLAVGLLTKHRKETLWRAAWAGMASGIIWSLLFPGIEFEFRPLR
jgi:hypothetical protein